MRRRNAHLVGDRFRPHIQRPAKDSGEAERVVHLIRKIGSSGGDNRRAGRLRIPRPHFGDGVGAGENDCIFRHRLDPFFSQHIRTRRGKSDHHIRTLQRIGDAAFAFIVIRDLTQLPLINEFGFARGNVQSAAMQNAFAVHHHAQRGRCAASKDETRASDVRRAASHKHNPHFRYFLANDL